jgi:hypothetical protein
MRPSGEPNTCIETYPFILTNRRPVQTQGLTTFARGDHLPQKQKSATPGSISFFLLFEGMGIFAVTMTGIGRFEYQLPPVFQAFSCRYPRHYVQRVGASLIEASVKPRCLPLPSVRLHAELVHKQVLGRKGGESLPFDSSKKSRRGRVRTHKSACGIVGFQSPPSVAAFSLSPLIVDGDLCCAAAMQGNVGY